MYGKESDNFNILMRNLEEEISNKTKNSNTNTIKATKNKEPIVNSNYSLNNSMKLERTLKKGE